MNYFLFSKNAVLAIRLALHVVSMKIIALPATKVSSEILIQQGQNASVLMDTSRTSQIRKTYRANVSIFLLSLACHHTCKTCKNDPILCESCRDSDFREYIPNEKRCDCKTNFYEILESSIYQCKKCVPIC